MSYLEFGHKQKLFLLYAFPSLHSTIINHKTFNQRSMIYIQIMLKALVSARSLKLSNEPALMDGHLEAEDTIK